MAASSSEMNFTSPVPSGDRPRGFFRRIYRSIFRHSFQDTPRNRSLVVFMNFFFHFHPVKVRRRAIAFPRTFYLGGLTAATFILLVASGVLLMLYYHPSAPRAYADMKDLAYVVPMGLFIRNLHRWGAHAMVALAFLHMLRVFYAGAYRPPREFNWVIGVNLFLITLLLSYTGYLLPWDQLSFWGVTVGTNIIRSVPWIGDDLQFLLLGGRGVGPNALLRFYVLHCVFLPVVLVLGIGVHIWRIRKDGGLYLPPEPLAPAGRPAEFDVTVEPWGK
ncbi:MAG: cytochrome b N-terminal domain-containing protein [Thermoanaerobaculia bacterium]